MEYEENPEPLHLAEVNDEDSVVDRVPTQADIDYAAEVQAFPDVAPPPEFEVVRTDYVPSFEEVPVKEVEKDEPKTPVKAVRPQVKVEYMQYSSALEQETFVEWGEGAVRFDAPFLTILNSKGGTTCNPGQWLVKIDGDFSVAETVDIESLYEEV